MKFIALTSSLLLAAATLTACKPAAESTPDPTPTPPPATAPAPPANTTGSNDGGSNDGGSTGGGHDHGSEVVLGMATIGDISVEVHQGHGVVAAGKMGHITFKMPVSDGGDSTVRAWLGTEDRTRSRVGRGEYSAANDTYQVHAVAPMPLPENVMWWIEIETPDGTKKLGSIKPDM